VAKRGPAAPPVSDAKGAEALNLAAQRIENLARRLEDGL
jgi:hypothetical protein